MQEMNQPISEALATHAVEELLQQGYTIEGDDLSPPDSPAWRALVAERLGPGVGTSPAEAPQPYGIVDPDYARVFTKARVICWQYGYALAMHGTFTRDLDLIAIPWTALALDPALVVPRIADVCGLRPNGHPPGQKEHGRLAWTLLFPEFEDPRWVDLSFMPRLAKPEGGA